MLKLMNLSSYNYDLERFDNDFKKLKSFLEANKMDGIELLNPINCNEKIISPSIVKGIHLKYYPIWLDFWKNDRSKLIRQFKNVDNVKKYYGGINKEAIIECYKREVESANKLGSEYVVFHVSHVELGHVYNYNFTYSDCDVIEAAAELVNEIFKDCNTNVKLLFENLWWPGLTFRNKKMACRLLEKVNYCNTGFMLDTAHLMNTNYYLKNEKQAVEFMLDVINDLGELKSYIKGLHLNCSLSGDYVLEQIKKHRESGFVVEELNGEVYGHILNIDRHKPFTEKYIKEFVDFVKPEYLVYEFLSSSLHELNEFIEIQNKVLML